MNIDETIYPYIKGEKFSNGLQVKSSYDSGKLIYRIELLEELVKGKKIIHLGCLDHVPLIAPKIKSNVWLHKRLTDISKLCLGIDIDKNGIEYVQNQIGLKNAIYADIINDSVTEINETHWDFIVMGEVLEHIDNPVEFLQKINFKYNSQINKAIITVPNAFRLTNFENAKKGIECINSDHRYWFTPFTLWKVTEQAGLKLIQIDLCESFRPDNISYLMNYRRYRKLTYIPLLRETIVATCSLTQ